mgnify:CR=1 FL=1
MRALVVDDSIELVEILVAALRADGFEVTAVGSGEQAVVSARSLDPDVIVLDLGLPGIDGFETCRQLRSVTDAYIVMLTSRDDEVDKIVGLGAGADDYMTKPFSPRELVARVRAMLRRPRGAAIRDVPAVRDLGAVVVDTAAREVTVDGVPVALTKIEFDLLDALTVDPKVVVTRAQLVERVWGEDWYGDDHVVDVHVSKLRRKLGGEHRGARLVLTVRGVGFRFGYAEAHQIAS